MQKTLTQTIRDSVHYLAFIVVTLWTCLGADFGVVTVTGISPPSFCAGVAGVSTTSLLQVLQIAVIWETDNFSCYLYAN